MTQKELLQAINSLGYYTEIEPDKTTDLRFCIYSKDGNDLLVNVYEDVYTVQGDIELELVDILKSAKGWFYQ